MARIYVASSWRNHLQQQVVKRLREVGHDVYDFKADSESFHWREIDPAYRAWTASALKEALDSNLAEQAFEADMGALRSCDACVYVLPCGRSASLELGWACGNGKKTAILLDYEPEPELMYKMADYIALSVENIVEWAAGL